MSSEHQQKTVYALSLAWQLGFLIALPLGGFIFLGTLMDHYFQTNMLFALAGAGLGLFITVYETHRLLVPLMRHDRHPIKQPAKDHA